VVCFREGAGLPRWQENQLARKVKLGGPARTAKLGGFARNYTAFSCRFCSRRVTEEREASHIENIIRAEFDPKQRRFGLRTHYRNIPEYILDPNGKVIRVDQIDIDLIKPAYEYYK